MAEFLFSPSPTAVREDPSYILQLEGISKGFPGQRQLVLREVEFRLPQGDILSIVGPSGCGKTTLLRTIAGFEQDRIRFLRLALIPSEAAENQC